MEALQKDKKAKITDNVDGVERSFLECGSGSVTRVTGNTVEKTHKQHCGEKSQARPPQAGEPHSALTPCTRHLHTCELKSYSFDWLRMMLITFE